MTEREAGRGGVEDPNTTRHGARQRWGPFWIEEPSWYWWAASATLLLGIALFAVLLVFDHP